MPIYEYGCDSCDHVFEEWQTGFEERELECPECGGRSRRLISNTSFVLKGSGWYVTDYSRGNGKGADGNGNGSSNGKTGSKTESKAEDKSSKPDASASKPKKDPAPKSTDSSSAS